jgi:hypothetical protein
MNKILEAAVYYAEHGLKVFPLKQGLKRPSTHNGLLSATTDLESIRKWFTDSNQNLAIATGLGLVVIDIDVKGGTDGFSSFQSLQQQYGQLPPTIEVQTPSGGKHYYYRYPEPNIIKNSAGKLGAGVDIRSEGGYVVAAPSVLDASKDPEGKIISGRYELLNTQAGFADLPTAWVELLAYKAKGSQSPKNTPPTYDTHDPDLAEVQDALSALSPDVNYDEWIKIGAALYHSLGEQGFSVWDAWSQRGAKYQAAEMRGKWASFQNNANPAKLSSLFYLAQQNGWQNPRKGQRPTETPKPTPTKPKAEPTAHSPLTVLDAALEQAEGGDITALQSDTVLSAFIQLRATDELAYQRYRSQVQALKGKVKPFALPWLDKQTKPPKKPRYAPQQKPEDGENNRKGKADLFIELVKDWAELFTDESGEAYASFKVEPIDTTTGEVLPAHTETWHLSSSKFQAKAGKEFYKRFGTVVGDAAMREALGVLAAEADDRIKHKVFLRYALLKTPEEKLGRVYVDLVNDAWEVVEIDAHGWRVLSAEQCPVKFRRVKHAKPLPTPEVGGNIEHLWQHVNITRPNDRLLCLAWILAAMRIGTPYPVLEIIAGQGSAKSTTQERLKVLIDPNQSNLRKEPDSIRDLSISAGSNHVISLNNLSHLSTAQQDFMCSMSTGGGDAARKLYTTDDEAVWDIQRPVVMNGINQLVLRPDLSDRTVCLELLKIDTYTDEEHLKAQWARDYPKLTGALYTLLSKVLVELPDVVIAKPPRMADFARLGTAMVKALGLDVDFVAAFNSNRDKIVLRSVDSSPVAYALLERIRVYGAFEGTLGELLRLLDDHKPAHYDSTAWPKSARGLGEILRRLAPALAVSGLDIEALDRGNNRYDYRVRKLEPMTDTLETEL